MKAHTVLLCSLFIASGCGGSKFDLRLSNQSGGAIDHAQAKCERVHVNAGYISDGSSKTQMFITSPPPTSCRVSWVSSDGQSLSRNVSVQSEAGRPELLTITIGAEAVEARLGPKR